MTQVFALPLKPVRSYRDLIVWQKAMDFVDAVYDIAEGFPRKEIFGLRSQVTRAAVSVPSNIAEGQARRSAKDLANFLVLARSSLHETETQLAVALRRGFAQAAAVEQAHALSAEISKMLNVLRVRILSSKRAR